MSVSCTDFSDRLGARPRAGVRSKSPEEKRTGNNPRLAGAGRSGALTPQSRCAQWEEAGTCAGMPGEQNTRSEV